MLTRITNYWRKHQLIGLARSGRATHPRTLFQDSPEIVEFWAHTHGVRSHPELQRVLPALPPAETQERFTGRQGDEALYQAFRFASYARRMARDHGRPTRDILNFACGWGRITRFFLRDVEPGHLWGVDCLPEIVDVCRATNPFAQFTTCNPLPPTSFADTSFDLLVAFSVFSHFSEDAHLRWLAEFRRILRPGGLAVLTTRRRDFITFAESLRANSDTSFAGEGARLAFHDTADALRRFDRGEYVYDPIGAGDVLTPDVYGETCIPEAYVRKEWARFFEIVEFDNSGNVCDQSLIVARRPVHG